MDALRLLCCPWMSDLAFWTGRDADSGSRLVRSERGRTDWRLRRVYMDSRIVLRAVCDIF